MASRPPARVRSSSPPPREKTIADGIRKWINAQDGCHARKTHGGAYGGAGWPDIVACVDGALLMLEVKRPGMAGATELQRRELQTWHNAGAVAAVVRSVDDARLLVQAQLKLDPRWDHPDDVRKKLVDQTSWEIRQPG